MSEEINYGRRRFLATAVATIASAELGRISSADARSRKTDLADTTPIKLGKSPSFRPLK